MISNIKAGTKLIPLKAGVDSGLKPDYYVSWGPAEIIGDNLRITAIPANAKFPIEVKVTAYQWGKSNSPKYSSSNTITRTFLITKN